jgi:hypothetical protein
MDAMTQRDNQFHNSASQAERRRMLELERASTLLEQAKISEALDSQRSKSLVVGTEPTIQYPPASGPWTSGWANVPDEPPLGYEINEQEPVGTPAEVERSLQAMAPTSPAMGSGTGTASPSSVVERDVGAALPPTPKAADRPIRFKRFPR